MQRNGQWHAVGILLWCLACSRIAGAQASAMRLSGQVASSSGAPIANAEISAGHVESLATRFARTDAGGRYHLSFPSGPASLFITARAMGFAPRTIRVTVSAGDTSVAASEIRLSPNATMLPPVRTVERPRASRDNSGANLAPGEQAVVRDLTSFLASDLTGDFTGDPLLAASVVPGVMTTIDPLTGRTTVAFAGLGADQNRTTVGGAEYGGVLPRDAALVRVSSSTYDPTKQTSGLQIDRLILSGTFIPVRRLHLTLDSPALQWTTPTAQAVGQRTSEPILSGMISGPARGLVKLHATSFQLQRRASHLMLLPSASASALAALGLASDSVNRALVALEALGIPRSTGGLEDERVTDDASIITRLDFTSTAIAAKLNNADGTISYGGAGMPGHVFYVIGSANTSDSRNEFAGPTTLQLVSARSRSNSVLLQAVNSAYLNGTILNETRSTVSRSTATFGPSSRLPAANVLMWNALPNGDASLANIQLAGNGGVPSSERAWLWLTSNETRWATANGRHEMKAAAEVTVEQHSEGRGESAGSFSFNSLADFVANQPASFQRDLGVSRAVVKGLHGALALGDVYRPSKSLDIQLGLRADDHRLTLDHAGNATVDSRFGVRSGHVPNVVALSPMAGFTWRYGPRNAQGFPDGRHSLVGGIRDYRGLLPARSVAQLARTNALADDQLQLSCVGAAVPVPEWSLYAADPSEIPSACAGNPGGQQFAELVPPVSLMAPDFTVSHSWRADLTWNVPLAARWSASLRGTSAVNTNQLGVVDLNFAGVSRFALAEEGGRPVYVQPTSIVPSSGDIALTDSRRYPDLARVLERRSNVDSRSNVLTATIAYRPEVRRYGSFIKLPFDLAYTYSDIRAESNGFLGTTAGDPRASSWARGASSRHALLASTVLRLPDWATFSVGLQARSGVRFTPRVSSDINGDGLANDRAFVFDAHSTSDTALGAAMTRLTANGDASAARCLRSQRGRVAEQNSCVGSWTTSLNATVTVDPARLGLRNRGTLQLHLANVLGGIDQLLHGADGLRGWGQPGYPDPTLLTVRGFDQANRRWLYTLNPAFGSTTRSRTVWRNPFRITLEVSLDVGPDRERAGMLQRLSPSSSGAGAVRDSAAIFASLAGRRRQFFEDVIAQRESLALTAAQVTSVERLGDEFAATRDSIYGRLAGYLAAQDGAYDDRSVQQRWHDALNEVAWAEWRLGPPLRALLTEAQAEEVFSPLGPLSTSRILLDHRELERFLKTWRMQLY